MSSAEKETGEGASQSKFLRGVGKIKGAPKNITKGANKIGGHVTKGAGNVGSNAYKGVNKGVSGISKGIGLNKKETEEKKVGEEPPDVPAKVPQPAPSGKRRLNTDLAAFDWEKIGFYQEGVDKGGDGEAILAKSEAMKTYLSDSYYNDYYVNTALTLGTCFFSWLVARLGGCVLWLGVVMLGTASVYRAEFRRFVRDTRDDMLRLSISDRLEKETETLEWCNNLLSKVWIVYMPLMGDIVKANVNPILAGVAPGNGIDSVELAYFHLGSVAPKVTAIKSYTKIGKSAYEMDWAFAFDPNNRENMTKLEIRKQIMPKVVLKAAIGKGIISKKVPVNVEDMGFVGRMKIRLTFTDRFPMIEFVRVQFLEPPKIDYALKPIGGDTLGIDIMKFIPGLKSLINDGINWAIKSFLISPNYQEVNLVDIMSAASTDINSVLVVNLKDASLPSKGDYYAVLAPANSAEDKKIKTETRKDTKIPAWNNTYYVLNNSIDQTFNISIYKKGNFGEKLVGTAEYDLTECYQKDNFNDLSVKIESSGKKIGYVNFDLQYFPELEAPTLEDNQKGPAPESEVGILKFVLNEAKGLDVSSSLVGQLSPYAEIFINGKMKHKTRVLRRSNEPSFGDILELLISSKSEANVKVIIKDSVGFAEDTVLGEYEGSIEDILTQVNKSGNDLFKLSPKGVIKITPTWRPLAMTEIASEISHKDPVGTFRIHIREALNLKNLEFHGKVDPYVKVLLNGKTKFETIIHPETLDPIFQEVAYIPVTSESQYISLEVYDAEKKGADRLLGSTSFKADKYMARGEKGYYYFVDGSEKVIKDPLTMPKAKNSKGYLSYSVSFIPLTPVYTLKELKELEAEDAKIKENLKKEEEEQKKLRELFKKNPNKYEWVEVDSPLSHRDPLKKQISLEDLLSFDSGALIVNIIKGNLSHKKAFLSVLVDENGYPSLVTGPASNGLVSTSFGSIFIRDLKNSLFVLREASKEEVEDPRDVLSEKTFSTLDILKSAYDEPATFRINENSYVTLQVAFNPSRVQLQPVDTMADTGKVTVDILNGENLISADSNGKSDPYAVLKLNGAKVVKTEVQKKTLNPKWNESTSFPIPSLSRSKLSLDIYDWDMAGDNDYLGKGLIDLSTVTSDNNPVEIEVPIVLKGEPAGKVNVRVAFEPKYIRPEVQKFGGGLPGIGSVTKAPVKLVGGVAKGALGGAGLIAGGVGKGGSKLIGAFTGGNKKKKRKSSQYGGTGGSNGNSDAQSTAATSSVAPTRSSAENGSTIANNQSNLDGESSGYNGAGPGPGSGPAPGAAVAGGAALGSIGTNSRAGNGSQLSRSATSDTAGMFGGKRSAGRITVKELHSLNDHHSTVQLKVYLKNNDLGTKEILKTRKSKLQGSGYKFGEEATFKAIPEDSLSIEAVVHHRLGKDEKIGEGQLPISSVLDNPDDLTVEVSNVGNLLLNVRYSAPN